MKLKSLLFLLMLSPMIAFCQAIDFPAMVSSEDPSTIISRIEITAKNTIITFKHTTTTKGAWIQLNKSMYLQDVNGEDRYNLIRSEGIPLRPLKHVAETDNEQIEFKAYFEKLKPGTKAINVIERARSAQELRDGFTFLNYYSVNLERSTLDPGNKAVTVQVAPPPLPSRFNDAAMLSSMETMFNRMYNNALESKLKFYSNPAKVQQMAKINKNYYDALLKEGFSSDAALRIITSNQLITADLATK